MRLLGNANQEKLAGKPACPPKISVAIHELLHHQSHPREDQQCQLSGERAFWCVLASGVNSDCEELASLPGKVGGFPFALLRVLDKPAFHLNGEVHDQRGARHT